MRKPGSSEAFYRHTIAALVGALRAIGAILDKAEKHAATNRIEMAVLLQARLYPDMYSLVQQLQYCCYLPVDFARHFTDEAAPRVGYDEADLASLRKSIETAIAYLESIDPARLDERADRRLPAFFDPAKGLSAVDYAARVIMPDFYFHAAVAYAILRHNGVPLGKDDFLGPLALQPL